MLTVDLQNQKISESCKTMYKDLAFDVIVIGGGPAGTVAALAAARNGASVLLVERGGFLGGMLTGAGVGPMMTFHAGKTQVVTGIPEEIVERLKAEGFSVGHMTDYVGFASSITPFDPEGMKKVLEDMCIESGVTLLYHTTFIRAEMDGDAIASVLLFSKNGSFHARAKVFVDASADADLSVSCGVSTQLGRETDGLSQPMTTTMLVSGVDRNKVIDFVLSNRDDMLPTMEFDQLRQLPRVGIQGARELLRRARRDGITDIQNPFLLCFESNTQGEFIINMTRVTGKNPVDAFGLTAAELEGRRQAWKILDFYRKCVPGFENARLASTGPNVGVRESRKINGAYRLTEYDLAASVMFPDAVAMGGYPIDVHSPDSAGGGIEESLKLKNGAWYSIPYRCLVTNEVRNLIVTGRCISVTHQACGAIRVTPVLMGISQGAGTAAAMICKRNCHARELDTDALREKLRMDGVFLDEYMP